jgi:hypothetical protein
MVLRIFFVAISLTLWSACARNAQQDTPSETDASTTDLAQQIVDQCMVAHGGKARYDQVSLAFAFRDRTYKIFRKGGLFQYERIFADSTGQVRDVLTNEGFVREVNGATVFVEDTMKVKYAGSIGSVVYFAMLPFPLNDPAVIKAYLGAVSIKGRPHHKIRVTFQQEGGGPEYEDMFMYWIDTETHYLNYMAYLYHTDGGGIRFREAYNVRTVGGVRMADYINYEGDPDRMPLEALDQLFEQGKLRELSRIENENIRVLPDNPL